MANSILLVHGAWHGAWCWASVVKILEAKGVETRAVDLPGHGSRRALAPNVGLDDYANAVVEAGLGMSTPPLLVGHSMGGVVISAAAERKPDAFRSLLYLTAFLPLPGQTLMDITARQIPIGRLDGGEVHLDDQEQARNLFYNDCPAQISNWALSKIQPQPVRPVAEKVELTATRFGTLSRDYIVCVRDQAIAPDFQREMAVAGSCRKIIDLNAGHSPMLSCPAELVEKIIQATG
jgi:pimeloyl-ACP methyl ester carboxylesterase